MRQDGSSVEWRKGCGEGGVRGWRSMGRGGCGEGGVWARGALEGRARGTDVWSHLCRQVHPRDPTSRGDDKRIRAPPGLNSIVGNTSLCQGNQASWHPGRYLALTHTGIQALQYPGIPGIQVSRHLGNPVLKYPGIKISR